MGTFFDSIPADMFDRVREQVLDDKILALKIAGMPLTDGMSDEMVVGWAVGASTMILLSQLQAERFSRVAADVTEYSLTQDDGGSAIEDLRERGTMFFLFYDMATGVLSPEEGVRTIEREMGPALERVQTQRNERIGKLVALGVPDHVARVVVDLPDQTFDVILRLIDQDARVKAGRDA